jgi:hypothetical protein
VDVQVLHSMRSISRSSPDADCCFCDLRSACGVARHVSYSSIPGVSRAPTGAPASTGLVAARRRHCGRAAPVAWRPRGCPVRWLQPAPVALFDGLSHPRSAGGRHSRGDSVGSCCGRFRGAIPAGGLAPALAAIAVVPTPRAAVPAGPPSTRLLSASADPRVLAPREVSGSLRGSRLVQKAVGESRSNLR